jgi:hypothetical protein
MMQKKRIWKLSEANRQNLIKLIQDLDCQKNWQVTIQESNSKDQRTLDQNRRYWDLMRHGGQFLGYTSDELHLLCGWKFQRQHKYVGNTLIEYIQSTTELDTAQMAEYQNQIEYWLTQMGWSWDD